MTSYYEAHREEVKARSKAWYEANTERARAARKAYHEANRPAMQAAQKVWRDSHKEVRRLQKYAMTPERYAAMVAEQDGRCKICQEPCEKFHIDHNHQTGDVRGLLCHGCNTAIGLMKENPKNFEAAARYVQTQGRNLGVEEMN